MVTNLGPIQAREVVPDETEQGIPFRGPSLDRVQATGGNLIHQVRLLWERRRTLLRILVCGLVVSTIIAFAIPVRYESTARLMPPDTQSSSSGLAIAAAAMSGAAGVGLGNIASDILGLKSTSDVFVGIMGSRTVQDKLIQQFDLRKLYGDRRMEDARKDLANRTAVSVDRKSQIIAITVTDKNPERAAAMAQAYVDELNRLVAELSTSSARRERIFLEGRLKAVSQDLETAEKEFSQFASKNTAIDVKEQGKAMLEGAATLQVELIAAQSEYEGLKQIYTDNNVRVRSAQARIDELKRQLNKLGGKGESSTSSSPESNDSIYPSIRKLPLLGVEYADLYRRTRIQEAVLETLTKEYEMAKVEEVKEIPTVKVLDPAGLPDKKAFPPRSAIVCLGTFLAGCVGVLFVFGSTSWKAIDPQQPEKQLVMDVWVDLKAYAPWITKNGVRTEATKHNTLEHRGPH